MKKRTVFSLLLAGSICLSGCAGHNLTESAAEPKAEPTETTVQQTAEDTALDRTVTRDGKTWRYNSRLRTVLFLGVDSKASVEQKTIVGDGGRSDTIILFVIDPDAERIRMMPISRDTITEIAIYNRDQKFLFNGKMQLSMQYAFGNSPARSCQLTKRAVSSLLMGLPIHSHCSLTLDGVAAAVDLVGGITLTLQHDWTDIDPSYVSGATVTMSAEQVEHFLRYRDIETHGSNNVRMSRQAWFIRQVFSQLGKGGRIGTEMMLDQLSPYLETDMDADTIKQMTTYSFDDDIIWIAGENKQGKNHDEFYIDEEALQELLLDVFYKPVE